MVPAAVSSFLLQFKWLTDAVPFEFLLAAHCILCASAAPEFKDRFLLNYLVSKLLVQQLESCTVPESVWGEDLSIYFGLVRGTASQ